MNKDAWANELQQYIRARRQAQAVPERGSLTDEEEGQCRIIGGEYLSWRQRDLSHVLSERQVLRGMGFDPEPLLVVTTSLPGLVALTEICPEPPPYLFYLLHEEFQEWEKAHPVDSFTFHIHHWSFFEPMDSSLLGEARPAFPKIAPRAFRVHQSGDLWAEQCGAGAQHLWHWDGQEMHLLEEAFSRVRY